MQAISTKYIGPTNFKGSRVKATAQAGTVTLSWNDALNSEQNHTKAAEALAKKFGWHGAWLGGFTHDGGSVFVCADIDYASGHFVIAKEGTQS